MFSTRLVCISVGLTILPMALMYFLKRNYTKKLKDLERKYKSIDDQYYYHCIFITMENIGCKQHIFDGIKCGDNCSYKHLLTLVKFISSAQSSISMCMYHFTLRQIADAIIDARKRGVNVRIISDAVTSKFERSKVNFLDNRHNFNVRTPSEKDTDTYMHHKFCLIDEKTPNRAKMFFGSLNLTLQGIAANFEFVVLTNNSPMIRSFSNEFELMWEEFK